LGFLQSIWQAEEFEQTLMTLRQAKIERKQIV